MFPIREDPFREVSLSKEAKKKLQKLFSFKNSALLNMEMCPFTLIFLRPVQSQMFGASYPTKRLTHKAPITIAADDVHNTCL